MGTRSILLQSLSRLLGTAAIGYAGALCVLELGYAPDIRPYSVLGGRIEEGGLSVSVGTCGCLLLLSTRPSIPCGDCIRWAIQIALGTVTSVAFLRYFTHPLALLSMCSFTVASVESIRQLVCGSDRAALRLRAGISGLLMLGWATSLGMSYLTVGK
jgi:hypothetical protein